MNEEKYFRVSDLRKLCDDSRDWDVPTFTLDDLIKHGHWTEIDRGLLWRCSECEHYSISGGHYCDWCGAKMDEVMDDNA